MNIIIYGPEAPKIGFKQSPSGSISFQIENERIVPVEPNAKSITWLDMFPSKQKLSNVSPEEKEHIFAQFIEELVQLESTPMEKKFFLDFVNECRIGFEQFNTPLWGFPALIPQGWVNWIHYDSKDHKRAVRSRKEPFRVDFILKDEDISPNLIVVEIDGSSHFKDMQAYTEHLVKDRWLRKQGWEVIRISNYEVERYNDFGEFFAELTGKWLSIPF